MLAEQYHITKYLLHNSHPLGSGNAEFFYCEILTRHRGQCLQPLYNCWQDFLGLVMGWEKNSWVAFSLGLSNIKAELDSQDSSGSLQTLAKSHIVHHCKN